MPIPAGLCDESAEPCCLSLSDIANHLLLSVFDALKACCETGCEGLSVYVAMGPGDDGIKDALTVNPTLVTASAGTRPGAPGLYRASFDVRLRESGWPTAYVDGTVIQLPEPALQAAASRYILGRGEAMHRKLASMASSRGLTPPGVRCANGSIGPLTPITPQGGVVGWLVTVTVDLPWG